MTCLDNMSVFKFDVRYREKESVKEWNIDRSFERSFDR